MWTYLSLSEFNRQVIPSLSSFILWTLKLGRMPREPFVAPDNVQKQTLSQLPFD